MFLCFRILHHNHRLIHFISTLFIFQIRIVFIGIVLVPTHALRMQTSLMISKLAEGTDIKVVGGSENWRSEKLNSEEVCPLNLEIVPNRYIFYKRKKC